MLHKHPLVSINLLTHNAEEYLRGCLASIFSQTYPNLEYLIIDNVSTDKTRDMLWGLEPQENLRIIFNKKNVGFAAGHNQGFKESRGKYILCLNQDAVLDNSFVKKAVEVFEKDNKVGAVQGKLLRWNSGGFLDNKQLGYKISHIIDNTGLVMLKNRRIIGRGQGEIDEGQFAQSEEIFGVDGAAPLYRRGALEDVKVDGEYFDEDFFCYKEDVDLAWRLRLCGWRNVYQPEAVGWHARTAGDSAAINYFGIIKERVKISPFAKSMAFKNQRLMQIKNEQLGLLIRHLPWFLPKEIAAWGYVLFLERRTWPAIKALFKRMPLAFKKRKKVMAMKKANTAEMRIWFK